MDTDAKLRYIAALPKTRFVEEMPRLKAKWKAAHDVAFARMIADPADQDKQDEVILFNMALGRLHSLEVDFKALRDLKAQPRDDQDWVNGGMR